MGDLVIMQSYLDGVELYAYLGSEEAECGGDGSLMKLKRVGIEKI